MKRALLAVALLVGCLTAPAAAHEELALRSLTVLGSLPSALDGVDVRIVHLGAPAFAVDNPTDVPFKVYDDRGRPFLEIGPRGVRADVSSKTFYASVVPGSHDHLVPKEARGPRWVTFSSEPRWTWFDPRLEADGAEEWVVPIRFGEVPETITGRFEPLDHHGHFVAELEASAPEGIDVRLVQGPVPVVYVRNDRAEVLEVLGSADEPFLRIGPRGVFANVMSPTYYSAGALTIKEIPSWADATATPRWERISEQPVWAWLEYRASVSPEMQQRDRLGSAPATVHRWTSPMTLAGEPLALEGEVRWVPPASGAPPADGRDGKALPRLPLLGLGGAIFVAGLFAFLRRPRTSIA